MRKRVLAAFLILTGLAAPSCSAPRWEGPQAKQATIDAVNQDLSFEDCASALDRIEGLYNSGLTDNQVRILRASAHGCNAGINFFKLVSDLTGANLTPPGFWQTMAKMFVSTTKDSKLESAWFAQDALFATLKKGIVVSSANQVNTGTDNPGSLQASDRVDDSNLYLIIVSMVQIGALENRFGAPNASNEYKKGNALPWTTAATVDSNGCGYAAAILNLLDGVEAISNLDKLSKLKDTVSTLKSGIINPGCDLGCQLPGCGFAAGDCNPCPIGLRHKTGCSATGTTAQLKAACAAAGLVTAINSDTNFGWLGP